jgi:hypothetical protein
MPMWCACAANLLPLIRLSDVIEVEPQFVDPETGSTQPDRRKSLSDRRSKKSPLFRENDEPGDIEGAGEAPSPGEKC